MTALGGSAAVKFYYSHWAVRDFALFAALATFGLAAPWSRPFPQTQDSAPTNNAQAAPTADQQRQATKDRELARRVRRSLVTDKSLSTYAHNIKIVAQNGVVTLKGPVRSDQEKSAIASKAAEIAGANNVRDEMSARSKS